MYKNGKPNYNEVIFSDEDIKTIIDLYENNHESSVKIGKRFNVSHKVILKLLKKYGINVDQKKSVKKYTLDEHYFDEIDTQDKAYILGLLYSDGSNGLSKGTISLSLQEDDREILEQIRITVNSSKPLEYIDYSNKNDFGYHYKNQYRLLFFSIHMCRTLNDIGMIPNKSLKLQFPNIPSELYSHFIRGYFDGDGSLVQSIKNDNNHPILVTLTSTKSFCNTVSNIIQEVLGVHSCITEASCRNGITNVLSISGRNVCKKFLDWIYQDANLYMQRKYKRYLDYYNINNSSVA